MPDSSLHNDPFGRDMMVQAFLYATGELEGNEALSFERRLGEDQAARDALCQAVLLCQPPGDPLATRPDPVYRERVRQRLRNGPMNAENRKTSRSIGGHPVLWGILGAAAAALLTLALQKACFPRFGNRTGDGPMPEKDHTATVANGAGGAAPSVPKEAPVISPDPHAEFPRTPHEEEALRKKRAEESRKPSPQPAQRPRGPIQRTVTN